MNKTNIKRFLVISLLLFCNLFLVYRYLSLDHRQNQIKKIFYEERGYGYSKQALKSLNWESNDIREKSLKLEFWVLVFFFVLVVYTLYVMFKIKLSHNDKKRVESRVPFKELDQVSQQHILSNIHCLRCGEKKIMIFKEEKMLLGKVYLIVVCPTCNNEIKFKATNL